MRTVLLRVILAFIGSVAVAATAAESLALPRTVPETGLEGIATASTDGSDAQQVTTSPTSGHQPDQRRTRSRPAGGRPARQRGADGLVAASDYPREGT
jgi:hypothetical protein